jgi:uncharacterized membrane protein
VGRTTRIFLAGLMAALPAMVTVIVTLWLVAFLSEYVGPSSRFGQFLISLGLGMNDASAYVLGVFIVLVAIYLLGLLVESRIGDWFTHLVDRLVARIPLVSSVYGLSKRFTSIVDMKGETNLSSMSAVWCFFGGEPGAAVLALLPSPKAVMIGNEEYLGILVPSAPVPVGGALVFVPAAWVRPAEGGVENLMSVYVSMGVSPPVDTQR